jgi:hypothetical protein
LAVVRDALSEYFDDQSAMMHHVSKRQWFSQQENLAVVHNNKRLFIVGVAASDACRYELSTAVKLLEYVTISKRLEATWGAILFHKGFVK